MAVSVALWFARIKGEVKVEDVVAVVKLMSELGCDEIDIADTIGVGTPRHVQAVMHSVSQVYPLAQISGHFHDTYGQALANIYAAMEVGVSIFHSSVAGLGGCPYAKGATGNVSTEDVLFMMKGLGIETGVDLDRWSMLVSLFLSILAAKRSAELAMR